METGKLHFKDVLGTSFLISVNDRDSVYLENLLDRYLIVLDNTKRLIGINDPLITAILAGFLLCDEIEEMKVQNIQEDREAERRIRDMSARINQIIPDE